MGPSSTAVTGRASDVFVDPYRDCACQFTSLFARVVAGCRAASTQRRKCRWGVAPGTCGSEGEASVWNGGRSVYRVTSISALSTPPGPPGMMSESRRKVYSRRLPVLKISTYLSNGSAE